MPESRHNGRVGDIERNHSLFDWDIQNDLYGFGLNEVRYSRYVRRIRLKLTVTKDVELWKQCEIPHGRIIIEDRAYQLRQIGFPYPRLLP